MNEDIFITSIHVKKIRNIENFAIHLGDTEGKHLIITGKNGSGKTSLLQEINILTHPHNIQIKIWKVGEIL